MVTFTPGLCSWQSIRDWDLVGEKEYLDKRRTYLYFENYERKQDALTRFTIQFASRIMRISFPWLVVCSVALLGCGGSRSGSVRIADVTKTNSISLTSGYSGIGGDLPSGITLHIHGKIDGSARVYADYWETTKLSGVVEWRIYHDWSQTNCVLHYVPESVRSGELIIDYTIH